MFLKRLKILPILNYFLRLLKRSECLETEIGVVTICHHDSPLTTDREAFGSFVNYKSCYTVFPRIMAGGDYSREAIILKLLSGRRALNILS